MREDTIAERYARALLDIGVDKGTLENLGTELNRVRKLFADSEELHKVMSHPSFDVDTRKKVLGELLERVIVGPTCRNFMLLLVDRNRISMIEKIAQVFADLVDQHLGRVRATVTVAQAMSMPDQKRLERALGSVTGKTITLDHKVDPSIIAGVVTEVDGRVFDGSVRTSLQSIGARLRAGI